MKKPFHLAWFLSQGYGPKSWRGDWPGSDIERWMMPDLFVDLARGMERACFDYIIIEDSSNVPYTYKDSHDTYLQYAASAPKLDPAVLVPYLAQATKHLGLVPTLSVSEYPPYLLARLVNSLDHVVTRLWEAWEPDAVVLDRAKPMFADGSKVHPINHEGKYFRCRGPLNAPRSPQGRVPICQAGGSPRGQQFASRWADTIITEGGGSVDSLKAYRDRVRQQAAEYGRNPDDIKVLFLAHPIIDVSMEGARERQRLEQVEAEKHLDLHLSGMSRLTGIDFAKYDLDQPIPATLTTNGHQSALAKWIGQTPRSILQSYARKGGVDFTGTADHVAGMMQEIMEEVGGDGFLIFNSYFDRRYVIEVCDGLVPERSEERRVGKESRCR